MELVDRQLFWIIGGLFGLIFGSAINAYVWRLKVNRSWTKGRSECSDCGHELGAKDLIPVLSWLVLGGKCRYCQKPIQDRPAVELMTALVLGLSWYTLAPSGLEGWVRLGFWTAIAILLIVLAVYDAQWLILPNTVMWPLVATSAVYVVVMSTLMRDPQVLFGALAASSVAGGAFFVLVAGTRGKGMGGGDIKLAFAMGLILGAQATAVAMLLAFNVAAIVGVAMIVFKKRGRRDPIPFGPYLVGGTIVAFLFGRQMVTYYLQLNGLS